MLTCCRFAKQAEQHDLMILQRKRKFRKRRRICRFIFCFRKKKMQVKHFDWPLYTWKRRSTVGR